MEIFVLNIVDTDGNSTVELYDSREDAQIVVSRAIFNSINLWDLGDSDVKAWYNSIHDAFSKKRYSLVVDLWHDAQDDILDYCDRIYYNILPRQIKKAASSAINNVIPSINKGTGATCRGQCKQYNEYASSDSPDGTFICYQCKTLDSIFGA